MKQIFISILLLFSLITVAANKEENKTIDTRGEATMVLSGIVSDEISGESLVGVEVKIEGTDLKTYTDFDGNFSFKNVKPGEYKLTTNYISYEKKSEILKVNSTEKEIMIKLQSSN